MTEARYAYIVLADGLVKIGSSKDPHKRAQAFAGTLIWQGKGGGKRERAMHRQYRAYEVRNEWFRREGSLAKRVDAILARKEREAQRRREREDARLWAENSWWIIMKESGDPRYPEVAAQLGQGISTATLRRHYS